MNRRLGWSLTFLLGVLAASNPARAADEPPAAPPPEGAPPAATAETPAAVPVAAPPVETPPPPPAMAAPMAAPTPPPPAPPPLQITGPGGSTFRFGILLQPQYQAVNSAPTGPTAPLNSYSSNLYIRRARLLFGGSILGTFEYFVDTDFANLFLGNNVGTAGTEGMPAVPVTGNATQKNTPGMVIQDAFGTWKAFKDMVKLDVGYMLPPLAHNAVQGATTLLSWDYLTYTFLQNANGVFNAGTTPAQTPALTAVGRDAGFQLRGLVAGGLIEYRAGVFQGLRNSQTATDVGARNIFRVTARLQVNLLDPETGFFYAGTYLGKKKVLSVGGAVDFQGDYHYYAGDVFADLPLGPGVLTAQVNVVHWHGAAPGANPITMPPDSPVIPDQTAFMSEAGYLINAAHLSPIIRVEHLWATGPDSTRIGGGLAFWPFGHNSNVKAFYSHLSTDGGLHAQNQYNLQWQLYIY